MNGKGRKAMKKYRFIYIIDNGSKEIYDLSSLSNLRKSINYYKSINKERDRIRLNSLRRDNIIDPNQHNRGNQIETNQPNNENIMMINPTNEENQIETNQQNTQNQLFDFNFDFDYDFERNEIIDSDIDNEFFQF